MNLLIITQKVDKNDSNLGFFHEWLVEFAKNFTKIIVICLEKKDYVLPENIKVISLGKDQGAFKLVWLFNFYKIIWNERKNYDAVFVHMTPIYAVLGGIFWKLNRKKISLWFTHKSVTIWLYLAEKFTDVIFTATPGSFRLASKKVKVIGHGINLGKFKPGERMQRNSQRFKMATVGRITPAKDYVTLIAALEIMKNKGLDFEVEIIGSPVLDSDKEYLEKLKADIKNKHLENNIRFMGGLSPYEVVPYLQQADLFVHMSQTGSLDKTILEAMACKTLIISSSDAAKEVVSDFKEKLIFEQKNAKELAEKIEAIRNLRLEEKEKIKNFLRKIAEKNDLKQLILKIKNNLEQ